MTIQLLERATVTDKVPSYDAKLFGAQVRQWREAIPLTQTALAKILGVGKSYISQIEGGRSVEMSLRFHQQYARALRMPFADYAEGVGIDLEGLPPIEKTVSGTLEHYLRDIEDLPDDDIEKLRELTRHYRRLGMLSQEEEAPPSLSDAEQAETEVYEDPPQS